MKKDKVEITLRISMVDKKDGKGLTTNIELNGTDHEIMELSEIAQDIGILGEAGVDSVLRYILDEDIKFIEKRDGPLH